MCLRETNVYSFFQHGDVDLQLHHLHQVLFIYSCDWLRHYIEIKNNCGGVQMKLYFFECIESHEFIPPDNIASDRHMFACSSTRLSDSFQKKKPRTKKYFATPTAWKMQFVNLPIAYTLSDRQTRDDVYQANAMFVPLLSLDFWITKYERQ